MIPPCIGEKHPRAVHPVDQIKKQTSVGGKPVSAFSLPKSRKVVILCDTRIPFPISVVKRSVPFPRTGFMACLFYSPRTNEREVPYETA